MTKYGVSSVVHGFLFWISPQLFSISEVCIDIFFVFSSEHFSRFGAYNFRKNSLLSRKYFGAHFFPLGSHACCTYMNDCVTEI